MFICAIPGRHTIFGASERTFAGGGNGYNVDAGHGIKNRCVGLVFFSTHLTLTWVSPANSFGYMDGGIDLAYLRFFGLELQSKVQEKIRSDFHGELPVGQALVVPTGHESIPYLVVAPTMRIPDKIGETVNVYLAFRAALLAVLAQNDRSPNSIKTLRFPALGTGVGSMPLARAAHQMHAAHTSVYDDPDWLKDPTAILLHHERLRSA
jgi:O-acetyl-ADP-ribose deacetylase (regulator of RNase III)